MNVQKVLSVYKPRGFTPYQVIQKAKEQLPEYRDLTMSYVGRLDPLAHGVLLLLVGEGIHEREKYLALPKEYECEVVFGVQTDTYDFLGLLTQTEIFPPSADLEKKVTEFVKGHIGKQMQSYPPFSSRTVGGKPLFWWAKNNKLHEVEIPQRPIEIFDFQLLSMGEKTYSVLEKNVMEAVTSVSGDFRQEETLTRWEKFFGNNPNATFSTAKFRISCGSGTYVRGLTHSLGEELGTGAVAAEIFRTSVGEYRVEDSLRLAF
jgi:tRNA pseudouridine55 synthase